MVTQHTRNVSNWKCPVSYSCWLKKFSALHKRMATQMDEIINNGMDILKWTTTGKTILYQKDPGKGKVIDEANDWNIANSVYEYLEMYNLVPV